MQLGIIYSLSASALFGGMYYLATLLRRLSGESLFGIRMVVTLPFLLFALFVLKKQAEFVAFAKRLKQKPHLILVLLLTSAIVGSQMWLFLWAPNSGKALEVSMGYLLMPIVAVALGKIVFKEHFTLLKWLSLGFAVLGVTSNIWLTGSFSWATIVAGVGYPLYITLRRYFGINTLATFFVELLLVMPFAGYFIAQADMQLIIADNQYIYYFLALFGLVNGAAFILYIASSNLLPVNVPGLLGYVEPLVMLCISFMIGEVLDSKSYLLMICLALAISLLTIDNFRLARK
ncbi:permease [Actinobacillus ureae]|uniref:EamA family transporter RarD n=1 Tax=Actinobacillus ureae TaxID=723 RepID=UPI000E13E62A|nr:EamA family transporter RarD [Actinobacillus ureae]SUT87063.1 permease [Actinobacillus ureae]SUU47863.1 permease [Actinobacillus ureae]